MMKHIIISICCFIYSFIHSFIHLFIHSFIHLYKIHICGLKTSKNTWESFSSYFEQHGKYENRAYVRLFIDKNILNIFSLCYNMYFFIIRISKSIFILFFIELIFRE